jgi:hypothetical protein
MEGAMKEAFQPQEKSIAATMENKENMAFIWCMKFFEVRERYLVSGRRTSRKIGL